MNDFTTENTREQVAALLSKAANDVLDPSANDAEVASLITCASTLFRMVISVCSDRR